MKVPIRNELFEHLISSWSKYGGTSRKGSQEVDDQVIEEELQGLIKEVNSVDR